MIDIHIDEFHHDCGKALSHLYNSFPRLITLYVDDLISNSGTDEYGIPTRRHKACFDALLWLAEEGYIRYQDRIRQDALDQVVLTEKSFLRLSLPIVSESETITDQQTTHAWQLRKATKSGSTRAINQAVITFLTL
ncbi:hypothetical protein ACH42_15855 [Endozoicomonas sp. (ex Bugula neritina AB1)]|nr:hypothetical protein ACH42_15855 [Endozoicomonas sp. (ex Bugula neritina AB1)]